MKVSAYTAKSPLKRTDKIYVVDESTTPASSKSGTLGDVADLGEQVFNVENYGAVGDGTTDDTTAIQAAINAAAAVGGGEVVFDALTYAVTASLVLKTGVILCGSAANDASGGTIIKTTSTTVNILSGVNTTTSLSNVGIKNLQLQGPGSGSGHGIYLQNTGSGGTYPPFFYFDIQNVEIKSMGGAGINAESLIVSTLRNVVVQSCAYGFYLNGAAHGAATTVNTSVSFINCYANVCSTYGYYCSDSTYINYTATAADNCGTAYYCLRGNSISYVSAGCEWSNPTSASPADGFVSDASYGVTYIAPFTFQNKHYSIKAINNATQVGVYNFNENSPVTATASLYADATSVISSYGSSLQTATGGTGIVVIMDDGVGNAQLYKAYVNSPTNTTKSVVTIDATQTLTNKTFDTAGAGNVLKINGTQLTAVTGTGSVVLATSPTLVTPTIGVATATSINKVAITAPATSATLTIANGKTLTVSNSLTLTGTDGSSVAFGTGGTVVYTSNNLSVFAATTSAQLAGIISDETGSGALVFATSPTLVTPTLGVATATSINKLTITQPATGSTLTILDGKTLTANNTLVLAGTDSTTMTFPSTSATVARTDAAQTFTGKQTFALTVQTPGVITVTTNAGTADVNHGIQTFTNSSAATMAITLATASAVDGQTMIIRIYDFSAVAQTIGWTNTENSTVSAPTTSNGSTSLPLTVGFIFNGSTSKWRCIAVA